MIIHFPVSVEKLVQWIEEEHIPAGTYPIVTDLEGVEEAAVSWNVNFFLNIFPKEFKLIFSPGHVTLEEPLLMACFAEVYCKPQFASQFLKAIEGRIKPSSLDSLGWEESTLFIYEQVEHSSLRPESPQPVIEVSPEFIARYCIRQ